MARLNATAWVSAVLGLAVTGNALAQTPQDPDDGTPTATTTTDDDDTTPITPAPTPSPDVDVDVEADVVPPPPPPPPITTVDVDVYEDEEDAIDRYGVAIAAGGGASGFTTEALSDATNVGGDWDVRLTVGTHSLLAVEGSYIGSAQSIDALGLDNDAILLGNGVQGALRVNATLEMPVQPFAYAGAAWRHYELTNTDINTSDVNDTDDVMEIPVGIGIAGRWSGLILDARGEFRATAFEDLMPERISTDEFEIDDDNAAGMHRWGVKATIGYEF